MSAEIEINKVNGKSVASFAENGRKGRAWHKLGQVFDRPMTVQEALEASHADYEVGLQEVFAVTPAIHEAMANGSVSTDTILDAIIKGRKATMRLDTGKTLGVVTDAYGVVQNADAFAFIDTLCSGGLTDHAPVIECAGVLGHGERVFVTAKFSEDIILDNKGDDRVEMYMVFTTTHDGSGSVRCLCTPIRVVCNNTLNAAMAINKGSLSLRHSINIMQRLDLTNEENAQMACKALNLMNVYHNSLKQRFEHLRAVKVSEKDLSNALASVVLSDADYNVYQQADGKFKFSTRATNLMDGMRKAIECGVGQEMGEKGTAMWLLNGLTTYFQNSATYKNEETKFDALLGGRVQQKVYKALMTI